jgi:hypothetical protein
LLATYAPDVRRGAAAVADVGERLQPVQFSRSRGYGDAAAFDAYLYRLIDLERDPAHRVDYILHPAEVHDYVVVYREAGQVLQRLDGQLGAARGEGGVDLVFPYARDRYERVARYGEHPAAGLRDHDGVRARSLSGSRVAPQQDRPPAADRQEHVSEREDDQDQQHQEHGPENLAPPSAAIKPSSGLEDLHAHTAIVVNGGGSRHHQGSTLS